MSAPYVVKIGTWVYVVQARGHAEAAEIAYARAQWVPPDQCATVQRAGDNVTMHYRLTSTTIWKAVPA